MTDRAPLLHKRIGRQQDMVPERAGKMKRAAHGGPAQAEALPQSRVAMYSATACVSSSESLLAMVCITALSLVRSRLLNCFS